MNQSESYKKSTTVLCTSKTVVTYNWNGIRLTSFLAISVRISWLICPSSDLVRTASRV